MPDTSSIPPPPTRRLAAPVPGWVVRADVVVIGSGVAGLTVALRCAAAGADVLIVTKALLDDGSTRWAQGGIAAALGEGDSPEQHLADTLVAGAGLCDEEAVRTLVTEGPDAVRRLIGTGAAFDTGEAGEILLTREGGHHRRRIAHAGGDATGAEISRALVEAVRAAGPRPPDPGAAEQAEQAEQAGQAGHVGHGGRGGRDGQAGRIQTIEHALVLDLLTDAEGGTAGVTLHVMGEGQRDGVGAVHARAVVLATGGMGQVFSATTNPAVSTGDGVALALRAGAEVSDLEFVQFHPTVLFLGRGAEGQQPLVSEAVRGEGAYLVDADGERFMLGRHELAELAPRDIVAKGIMRRMRETGAEHMFLDARHFGAAMWERRFPTILAACRSHGIDPVTEPIPVAPAAHYASGGVRTDLRGRTSVPGLYACGEVACTGVHGANRLASNSLLEGLVFAERIAADMAERFADGTLPRRDPVGPPPERSKRPAVPLPEPAARHEIQRIMTRGAGVLRSGASLAEAADRLAAIGASARQAPAAGHAGWVEPCVESWETANLHLVASVLVAAAALREETRGCHWREDRPDRDDTAWRRHVLTRLTPGGGVSLTMTESEAFTGNVRSEPSPGAAGSTPSTPSAPSVPSTAQQAPKEPASVNTPDTASAPAPAGAAGSGSARVEPVSLPLLQIGGPSGAGAASAGGCGEGCGCGDAESDEAISLSALECGLDPDLAELLADAGLDPVQIEDIAHLAIEEDLDHGVDVTSVATVPEGSVSTGDFTARQAGTVAGLHIAEAVLTVVCTDEFEVERHVRDGDRVEAGQVLLSVTTRTRDLLTGERSALNLLCRLSGIATATRAWADALEGTGAKVRDTRKTTVGLRALEKYAVRCGGGVNHRMSLSDAALVKDNHVIAAGGIAEAFKAVRAEFPDLAVEVEVDRLDQIPPILAEGADLVLLDNFTPEQTREAVELVAGRALVESSGGLSLDVARAYAEAGVDYLAVGALTHSSPILDIGLDLRP